MTKTERDDREREERLGQQALFAVLCDSCPYADCLGAKRRELRAELNKEDQGGPRTKLD